MEEARKEFTAALLAQPNAAAETLGHIDYKYYVDSYSHYLEKQGDSKAAAAAQDELLKTLSQRAVLDRVLEDIEARRDSFKS